MEGSAPRVRSSSISSMSQLLLAGWAMLADSCPECGVPLMRSPDRAQLLCTNCGRDTTSAPAAAAEQQEQQPEAEQPPAIGNGPIQASSFCEEGDLVELPLRNRLQAAAAAQAPARHVHFGTASPGSSYMAAAYLRQAGGIGPAEPRSAALHSNSEHRGAGSAGGQVQQARGHDASQAIAELMLEGWTMLQDHCPRCLNPLLRSRDRLRTYCAGCQLNVVREVEQQAAARAAGGSAAAGSSAAAHSQVAAPAHLPTTALLATPNTGPAPSLQHLPAVDAAAEAVAVRLEGVTAALQAAEAAPEAAAALLGEVRQCAEALTALAECRRSLLGHH